MLLAQSVACKAPTMVGWRVGIIACLFGGVGVGCVRTWAEFTPYSSAARSAAPMLHKAVFAYEGDIESLAYARAQIIGTLRINGNGWAGKGDLRYRALTEAASYGGTHVILGSEAGSASWHKITSDRATTTLQGNTATTTFEPGREVRVTKFSGGYVIVRVEYRDWPRLPAELQPRPGLHYTPATEAPQSAAVSQGGTSPGSAPGATTSAEVGWGWFCITRSETLGICFRELDRCKNASRRLGTAYGACEGRREAYCFSTGAFRCHPTMQACRTQRDYEFSQGKSIVAECARSE